jgi:4-hydroxy-2-oxoheptanedioate aldolase
MDTMADLQIKRKLAEGRIVNILSGVPDPDTIDLVGPFGFDGIWIETEHGPVSWREIGDFSRACDLWDMASVVRIPVGEPWVITRTLDRGASAIVVPHVSDKETATKVAVAAKFGPIGLRGIFTGRRSFGVDDYYNKANEETMVIVLIEEVEAVDNLAEILEVPNIDVFFVAPGDLAQTMGHIGKTGHPEVQDTVDDAIRQIVAAGRTAGALALDGVSQHYYDLGARFFMCHMNSWVTAAAAKYLAQTAALES